MPSSRPLVSTTQSGSTPRNAAVSRTAAFVVGVGGDVARVETPRMAVEHLRRTAAGVLVEVQPKPGPRSGMPWMRGHRARTFRAAVRRAGTDRRWHPDLDRSGVRLEPFGPRQRGDRAGEPPQARGASRAASTRACTKSAACRPPRTARRRRRWAARDSIRWRSRRRPAPSTRRRRPRRQANAPLARASVSTTRCSGAAALASAIGLGHRPR